MEITYLNTGKGFLFIPSGLGYPSSNANNYSNSLVDTNLLFYIDLLEIVEDTDHDNDGVPSIQEDADGDGDPTNDFSDNSNPNVPDYLNPNIN
jgi:FKBP-type peptidyl-prolyl cis-trans isomerase FkpA